ncbi:NHL domain-containing protein, partial [Winogradskyella pacifica]|uniref:NHL domain-containing protein n=1 Tax=Winogradskyella pacifica TaxID=664642 RepID=UPI000E255489
HTIRKIDNSGIITTIAGTGVAGYSGDGGLATSAQLNGSFGLTFDISGNLLIADRHNNVIRQIDNSGIITTIAGTGVAGYSGDGGLATSAQLNDIRAVAFNSLGEMYITDGANHVIRKIDNSGFISTVYGNNTQGYSGDGGLATSAQLNYPRDLIFDNNDNLYFSSASNHTIRKIDNSGIITTIAGTGVAGYSGDGGLATSAQLNSPYGITFDTDGNLLISDRMNNIIRQLNNVILSTNDFFTDKGSVIIYPNPSNDFIQLSGLSKKEKYKIYNILGSEIASGSISNKDRVNVKNFTNGLYLLKFDNGNTIKFIKE